MYMPLTITVLEITGFEILQMQFQKQHVCHSSAENTAQYLPRTNNKQCSAPRGHNRNKIFSV